MIPKTTIEEIRSRCSIAEVVAAYIPQLKEHRKGLICCCPFHQEKTPSFHVNEERQMYHCFGCKAGGDVFRFVMEYEKVDFVTAVNILAERAGVEIVYEGGVPEKSGNKDVLYKLHSEAAAFFNRMLTGEAEGEEARRYLQERDLPEEMIKAFQVGFAPNGWDGLLSRALKKGYDAEQVEAAGLAVASDKGGRSSHYDRFRNRIMFPICDPMGRVIGFSGRIMNQAEKTAKYVNSPETLLFRKNQVLFALDKARKAIVDSRQAVVVEGQIDAIRCHQYGLTNVVASQGTALTENHARLIKRSADEVVLVLDSDAAGQKAALASSEIFVAHELSVRVVTLPEKEDPDSLLKKSGPEALRRLIDEAPGALDYLMDVFEMQENTGTEAGRMRVVQAVLNLIRQCPSAARRDPMVNRAADRLHISPDALKQDLRRNPRPQRKAFRQDEGESPPPAPVKTYPQQETALLELLVRYYHELQPLVHDYLPASYLTDPVCRDLMETLMLDTPGSLLESFHDFDPETQRVVSQLQVAEARKIDAETDPVDLAKRYILLFWKRHLEREMEAVQRRPDISNEERFKEVTRIKLDIFAFTAGWEKALPVIEARQHVSRG